MLDPFKGEGRYMTMDSGYMGDIMALVGHHEWRMNMVGTATDNRVGCGPVAKERKKIIKRGTYEFIMFQHNKYSLHIMARDDI